MSRPRARRPKRMICISQDVYLKALCFILSLSLFLFLSLFLSVSSRVKIHARGNCVSVSRDVYSNALPFALSLSLSLSLHTSNPRNLATALRLRNVAPFGLEYRKHGPYPYMVPEHFQV